VRLEDLFWDRKVGPVAPVGACKLFMQRRICKRA
jgi:hypothetical protein